jgi:hypothetical protein
MKNSRYTTNSQKTRTGTVAFPPDPGFVSHATVTAASDPFWHPYNIAGSRVVCNIAGSGDLGINLDGYVTGNGPSPYASYVVVIKATNNTAAPIGAGFSAGWMILEP